MKYTVKKEKSEVTLEFKVDAAEWKEAESKAYSQTKGKYAVPGFRKGHAPKHVIEQYYGAGVFADDAMDIIIQSGWDKFLDENEKKGEEALVPVDRPSANIVSMDDKGVKFTLKFPVTPEVNLGDTLTVDLFTEEDWVDVTGISKGKGFQGVVKRHGFGGVGGQTHGQHNRQRKPGSLGASSYPSRVFKGKRLPGQMGGEQVKVLNLRVLKVIPESNLILVKGSIPGAKGAYLTIEK